MIGQCRHPLLLAVVALAVGFVSPAVRIAPIAAAPAAQVAAAPAAPVAARGDHVTEGGTYRTVAPTRLLDTRTGLGARKGSVGPHHTLLLQVRGRGGVPSYADVAALNVTVTQPTARGFVTIYRPGDPLPKTSVLNFDRGQTVANVALASYDINLPTGGKVLLYNGSGGTVQFVVDLLGYFLDGNASVGGELGFPSARLLDTRTSGHPLAARGTLVLQVTGRANVPARGVGAVAVDVTVTNTGAAGHVTVYQAGKPLPGTSNVNFGRGATLTNLAFVKVGGGKIALYNASSRPVDLLVDIRGYSLAGTLTQTGAFGALDPARVLDTRSGVGAAKRALGAGQTLTLSLSGRGHLPQTSAEAVVLNLTVVSPTHAGHLTVYPTGDARPTTSAVNFPAGHTVANVAIVKLHIGEQVSIYNGSAGSVQVVGDVQGYFRTRISPLQWTSPTHLTDGTLTALSCTGSTFCVALDSVGNAYTFNGSTWTTTSIDPGHELTDVWCGSSTSCLAVDNAGNYVELSASGWSAPAPIDGSSSSTAVTCGPKCLAVGSAGNAYVRVGTTWSALTTVGTPDFKGVTCDPSGFAGCLAWDDHHQYEIGATSVGGGSPIAGLTATLAGLALSGEFYGMAVDADGHAVMRGDGGWLTSVLPIELAPAGAKLTQVQCPDIDYCVATGTHGVVVDFSSDFDNDWSIPTIVGAGNAIVDQSCPRFGLCGVIDDHGNVMTTL